MKHPYTYLTGAVLALAAAAAPSPAQADELRVAVVAPDGTQSVYLMADIDRIELGDAEVTMRLSDGASTPFAYTDIDRITLGSVATGISEITAGGQLAAWPVPVKDTLHIAGAETPDAMVRVTDTSGLTVATARCAEGRADIDLADAAAGTYIVTVGRQSVKIIKN